MPPALQVTAQCAEVVDLAVEDDAVVRHGVAHRLAPGRRQVEDTQTRVPENDAPPVEGLDPPVVGAAVSQRADHPPDHGLRVRPRQFPRGA